MRSSRGRNPAPRRSGSLEAILAAAITGLAVHVLTNPKTPPANLTKEPAASGPGTGARAPTAIPARGWRQILRRTWREFNADHITVIAGGVTYSVLLSIFPALGAFVALYGLVADVSQIPKQIETLSAVLPGDVLGFLGEQMTRLAQARRGGLSLAVILGLLISFWSANGAMKAFFVGLNVAYETTEKRNFLRLTLTTLGFTLGLILFVIVVSVALASGVAAPFFGPEIGKAVQLGRWPLLVLSVAGALAVLYRYGPCRPRARWRWVSPGSVVATVLWLAASLLFSLYAANFAHYDRTYGSLGAVIALMVWIWISAVIVLFGAELNSEVEHQAAPETGTLGKAARKP